MEPNRKLIKTIENKGGEKMNIFMNMILMSKGILRKGKVNSDHSLS